MRPEDRVRVLHMADAAETIASFVSGRVRKDLDSDRMLLFALVRATTLWSTARDAEIRFACLVQVR